MADIMLPEGTCGSTYKDTSDDTVHSITEKYKWSKETAGEGKRARGAILTFEVDCRFTFNSVTPTQDTGTGLGHVASSGDTVVLESWDQVNTIQWVNKVSSTNGDVIVTVLF